MLRKVNGVFNRAFEALQHRPDEEKLHFAHHDETELGRITSDGLANGTVTGQPSAAHNGIVTGPGSVRGLQRHASSGNFNRKEISAWDAGWNVTNAIQGMFLVALPYGVLHGGYWTLLALVAAAIITCYTGIILVECLYEISPLNDEKIRVRETYVSIAREVWGARFASRIVHTAQFIELIMTCILYLVLCGDMMYNTFPIMSESAWTVVASFFVVPCAFLRDLKAVSRLSFGNAIAHVVINVVVVGFCMTQISSWQWSKTPVLINIHHFPVSLGIVVFSYTSHIFLPSLEGSMRNRGNFRTMLYWTHGLAGLFKFLFAYLCFLTFANATQEVITDNLPTEGFKALVSICLVAKALLSYPLPYFAAAELLERAFFQGRPETVWSSCYAFDGMLHTWAVVLRIFLVLFSLILAVIIPHFALLMGLIGSFTGTMLSFVWPCWFHLKIKWHDLRWYKKALDIAIISSGFMCCGVGIIFSTSSLVEAYQEQP